MQKITPFLWFDHHAEEAVDFYVSIFENSKIVNVARYGEEGAAASGRPKGSVMTVSFLLDGQEFLALNGGPVFAFSPAISFVVNCETQEEVDPAKSQRVMQAMLEMKKLDVEGLKQAAGS
jgi:predicted 3-demethylubiquinone-9 3-methyltransferase (glyoxalase superfamily)